MPALARADLERLLQARKLGVTLPTASMELPASETRVASLGLADLDGHLGGGWPRGHVSELTGPLSAGATWVACASLAAATRRGELAALIDPVDTFDPESAATAGFVWPHLLWVRGTGLGVPSVRLARGTSGRPRVGRDDAPHVARGFSPEKSSWHEAVQRALKALTLILQAEGLAVVVLDLHGIPPAVVRQLPLTTWRRVQRIVEGRETACVLMHGESVGRSAGGVTLALEASSEEGGAGCWTGRSPHAFRLLGVGGRGRVVRAQWQLAALEGFTWRSDGAAHVDPASAANVEGSSGLSSLEASRCLPRS
jgi:hypothetical protein